MDSRLVAPFLETAPTLISLPVPLGGPLRSMPTLLLQVFLNETSLGILTDVYRDIDIPPITVCNSDIKLLP